MTPSNCEQLSVQYKEAFIVEHFLKTIVYTSALPQISQLIVDSVFDSLRDLYKIRVFARHTAMTPTAPATKLRGSLWADLASYRNGLAVSPEAVYPCIVSGPQSN